LLVEDTLVTVNIFLDLFTILLDIATNNYYHYFGAKATFG